MSKTSDNGIYILEGVPVFRCFSCKYFCSDLQIIKTHMIAQHKKSFRNSNFPFYNKIISQVEADISPSSKTKNDQMDERPLGHFYDPLLNPEAKCSICRTIIIEKTSSTSSKKPVKKPMIGARFTDTEHREKVFFTDN